MILNQKEEFDMCIFDEDYGSQGVLLGSEAMVWSVGAAL